MDALNRRYQAGHPSTDLAKAGLILHSFDELDDPNEPWVPIFRTDPDHGISGSGGGVTTKAMSDRICASLVWAGLRGELRKHIFYQSLPWSLAAGFVLSPGDNLLNCAYGGDGGTNRRQCSPPGLSWTCVPGCGPAWCDEQRGGQCSTRLEGLAGLLEYQGQGGERTGPNELVFDQRTFEERLPHSVEAIWWDPERSGGGRERAIHQRFCQRFGLRPEQVPFVRLLRGGSGPIFGT